MSSSWPSDYQRLEERLLAIPKFSDRGVSVANFDLSRMEQMSREIGDPHRNFPTIHVAGTNGKGTVCRMLASVYQEAGFRTGLYTSPHLIDFRERFRVNAEMMSREEAVRFFQEFGEVVDRYRPTFFELTTLMAFWYFREQNVDVALIETGLGGRLDATNIIDPACSVITSVGLDHTDILGESIREIASEKAGIIKQGKPVVAGFLVDEAMKVITDRAAGKRAPMSRAITHTPEFEGDVIRFQWQGQTLEADAAGRKQVDALNIGTVAAALTALNEQLPASAKDITGGIKRLNERFPHYAGFEKLNPGMEWYFDGAHNSEAVKTLREELLSQAPAEEWTVILSFMRDKLTTEIAEHWRTFPNLKIAAMDVERGATSQEMRECFPEADIVTLTQESPDSFRKSLKTRLVIFSGSFYFYEKVRRWMGTKATDK